LEIQGLLPVIINVTPVSIPLLLGLEAEGQETNCVAEVLQKGYKLNGKVLRCAMVKVTD